jgi:hypothetical protein
MRVLRTWSAALALGLAGCTGSLCDGTCWLPYPEVCLDPGGSDTHDVLLDCSGSTTDCVCEVSAVRRGTNIDEDDIEVPNSPITVPAGHTRFESVTIRSTNTPDVATVASIATNCTGTRQPQFTVDVRNTSASVPCQ